MKININPLLTLTLTNDTDESENILWNISGFRAPKSYDMTALLLEPPIL